MLATYIKLHVFLLMTSYWALGETSEVPTAIAERNYHFATLLQAKELPKEIEQKKAAKAKEYAKGDKDGRKINLNNQFVADWSEWNADSTKSEDRSIFKEVIDKKVATIEALLSSDTEVKTKGGNNASLSTEFALKEVENRPRNEQTEIAKDTKSFGLGFDNQKWVKHRKETQHHGLDMVLTEMPISAYNGHSIDRREDISITTTNIQQRVNDIKERLPYGDSAVHTMRKRETLDTTDTSFSLKTSRLIKNEATTMKRLKIKMSFTSFYPGFDADFAHTVSAVVRTIPSFNLFIVYQTQPACCLLESLWNRGTAAKLYYADEWWTEISKLTYLLHSQHILVGSTDWIAGMMKKVQTLYNKNLLNTLNTKWIWLSTEKASSGSLSASPTALSFTDFMEKITKSLQEGVRGVLLVQDESTQHTTLKDGKNFSKQGGSIKVAGIEDPGDGSWTLMPAAIWNSGFMKILKPLWPKPSYNFHNRTVRMSVVQEPIVFEYTQGGGLDKAGGYLSELMIICRSHLNFTDVVLLTQGYGATEANGSWNGMIGALYRKEADIAPLDFSPSWARAQVVDLSYPIGDDLIVLLSRAPDIIIRPFLLLQIFSLQAWACIIASALFTGAMLELLVRAENIFRKNADEIDPRHSRQWSSVLMIYVYQSSDLWSKGVGSRVAACGVMFTALILGSLYSGSITAFFAIPFRSKPIDSAVDLLASNVRPAVRAKTVFYETLIAATNGILHPARERAVAVGSDDISTIPFLSKVADGTYALADAHHTAVGRAKLYEKPRERCKLYIGKEQLRTDMDVLAYQRNSPFSFQIDRSLQRLKRFGIIDQVKRKYFSLPCSAEITSDAPKPMTVLQVQGAFYVLGVGLLLGFFCFLCELIWSFIMK